MHTAGSELETEHLGPARPVTQEGNDSINLGMGTVI